MTAPKHYVTAEEATLVRWIAEHDGALPTQFAHAHRIFLPHGAGGDEPIGKVDASGRSSCRLCGETIERGEKCVVFGFDPRATADGPASWGTLARAYLHLDTRCKRPTPEEEQHEDR